MEHHPEEDHHGEHEQQSHDALFCLLGCELWAVVGFFSLFFTGGLFVGYNVAVGLASEDVDEEADD